MAMTVKTCQTKTPFFDSKPDACCLDKGQVQLKKVGSHLKWLSMLR